MYWVSPHYIKPNSDVKPSRRNVFSKNIDTKTFWRRIFQHYFWTFLTVILLLRILKVNYIVKTLEIYRNKIMCHSTPTNPQGSGQSNTWEEEARRQNQLYPDLSELLDSLFSPTNPNATSQTDQDQRQSILRNILSMFATNISPEQHNNSGNQQPSVPTQFRPHR